MGSDASAKLSYGVVLSEDDSEQPWASRGDLDDWWLRDIHHYKPPFKIYDHHGRRFPDITASQWDEYYAHLRKFKEDHPCPVELISYGSYDYVQHVLALEGTSIGGDWSDPTKINSSQLREFPNRAEILLDFCNKYGVKHNGEPGWYLTVFYG